MIAKQQVTDAVRQESSAVLRSVRQAWSGPGRERDLVVQSLKAALAAAAAWALAQWLLPDTLALMAPWVAVVLVQSTVYRSVAQGLQQTFAIAFGTMLATAVSLLLHSTAAAMAVVLPVTLLVGNWPRLGDQGIYSATSALFTLVGGPVSVSVATDRVLAALIGAALGIGVNALVRPPAHLRSTRQAVREVIAECVGILEAVADGLTEPWTNRQTLGWWDRARRLPRLLRRVRSAVDWSKESARLNPDRRWRTELVRAQSEFEGLLSTLEEVAEQIQGLTRTLLDASEDAGSHDGGGPGSGSPAAAGSDAGTGTATSTETDAASDSDADCIGPITKPDAETTESYAAFLRQVAAATDTYGRSMTGPDRDAAREELSRALRHAQDTHESLQKRLAAQTPDDPGAIALFGSLLAHARRLLRRLGS
ncbi:aromatic acid exporter family protein [Streptomyces sp. MST-110588]|uniref:FUSC family protein n=1 Tax=Streptomyces sp. MST-110588 TaxID=2833628 RepID=UPI001F5DBA8D|nr:aromatic acid exporter family protein [Streptomyces sp. MST-110588]UNO43192.1 hypothetical protein KGS77_31475 [Streptomyces sp. MST-110588]